MKVKLEQMIKTITQKEKDPEQKKILLEFYEAYVNGNDDIDLQPVVNYINKMSGSKLDLDALAKGKRNTVSKIAEFLVLFTLDKFYFDNSAILEEINEYFKEDYYSDTHEEMYNLTEYNIEKALDASLDGDQEEADRLMSFNMEKYFIASWTDTYDTLVRVTVEGGVEEAYEFCRFVENYVVKNNRDAKNPGVLNMPVMAEYEKWKANKHYVDDGVPTKKLD